MDDEYFICTNCHGSGTIRVTTIEKDATLISKDRLKELEEKEKKWDSFNSDIVILGPDTTGQIAEIYEWKEKAKKLDEIKKLLGN